MSRGLLIIGCGLLVSVLFFAFAVMGSGIWQSFFIGLSSNLLIALVAYFFINLYLEKRNWRGSMRVINEELLELSNMLVSYVDIRILGKNNIPDLWNIDDRLKGLKNADISLGLKGFDTEDWKQLSYNILLMREKLKSFLLLYSPALTFKRDLYSRLLAVWRGFSKFDDWFGIVFVCIDQKENENFPHIVDNLAASIKSYLDDVKNLRELVKND